MADRIADALVVDFDFVLSLLAIRPTSFEVDPQTPEGELVAMIRRIRWDEDRFEAVEGILTRYIDVDRRRAHRARTTEER